MGQVGFIDSSGVGILATLHALSKHQGRNLMLCRVTPLVHIVLELARLDQVLQVSRMFGIIQLFSFIGGHSIFS